MWPLLSQSNLVKESIYSLDCYAAFYSCKLGTRRGIAHPLSNNIHWTNSPKVNNRRLITEPPTDAG